MAGAIVLNIFSRMKPKTSAMLKFGESDCVLVMLATWLPASKCCVKPFDRGEPERCCRGIVLVVILQRQSVFGGRQVVQIRDGLIGNKIRRLREKHIFRKVKRGREIGIRRRESCTGRSAAWTFSKRECTGLMSAAGQGSSKVSHWRHWPVPGGLRSSVSPKGTAVREVPISRSET